MVDAELALWEAGGVKSSWVEVRDVCLGKPDYYIRQTDIKPVTPGLPRVLMIHGFGGGGPVFCRMAAHMRTHFSVTTIDLLGLGGSGRPDFISQDYEYATSWFLDSIH